MPSLGCITQKPRRIVVSANYYTRDVSQPKVKGRAMFKCDLCGEQSKPNQKAIKIVLETRERKYVNLVAGVPKESVGHEIVREAISCGCHKQ